MAARLFAILAVSPRSAMAAVSPRNTMAARVLAILAVAVLFADTSGFTVRETDRLDELPPSIRALLAKMTTEEKARQLVLDDAITVATYDGAFNETLAAAYLGGLGAGVLNWGRDVDPNLANAIQDAVVAASRHGIPALFAEECQHGVQGDHHTIFPSPPALAATFDVDLLRDVGAVVGAEARAGGTAQCWAPVCGLAREPRWGRGEEELGEDAYLAGELAGAMVRGMTDDGRLDSPNATSSLPASCDDVREMLTGNTIKDRDRRMW